MRSVPQALLILFSSIEAEWLMNLLLSVLFWMNVLVWGTYLYYCLK